MMWFHLHAMLSKLTIVFQCLHVTETFNATADDWKKMHVAPCGVYMSWPYLSLYIFISIYIYTTFLPMELIVADSTSGLAACVARPLHWVSVVLLASPQHFFSRPLTEAPVSWRWRSPDQLAQHGWFFWFLLFRLRSLWSGGLRSCKQEGCKGYTPV